MKIYYLLSNLLDPFDQTTKHCIAEIAATVAGKCIANRKSSTIFSYQMRFQKVHGAP